jgi:hypothetical protein
MTVAKAIIGNIAKLGNHKEMCLNDHRKRWDNFILCMHDIPYSFADDWGYSFPGWYANCGIGVLLKPCFTLSLSCNKGLALNEGGKVDIWNRGKLAVILQGEIVYVHRSDVFSATNGAIAAESRALCSFMSEFKHPWVSDVCASSQTEALDRLCNQLVDIFLTNNPNEEDNSESGGSRARWRRDGEWHWGVFGAQGRDALRQLGGPFFKGGHLEHKISANVAEACSQWQNSTGG